MEASARVIVAAVCSSKGFPAFGPRVDVLNRLTRRKRQRSPGGQTFRAFLCFRRLHIALFPVFLKLARPPRAWSSAADRSPPASWRRSQAAGADVIVVAPEVCDGDSAAGVTIVSAAVRAVGSRRRVVRRRGRAAGRESRALPQTAERRHVFVNAVDDPPNATRLSRRRRAARTGVTIGDLDRRRRAGARRAAARGARRHAARRSRGVDADGAHELRRDMARARVPMAERRPLLLDALNALYDDVSRRGRIRTAFRPLARRRPDWSLSK